MTIQPQLELRPVTEFDTTTTDGCIEQIVYGFNVVNAGYGIADSALVAYLQIDGNTATTLVLDLKAAGCPMAPSTIRNRCSQLVTKGLVEKTSNAGRPKKAKVEESAEAITEAVIHEAVVVVAEPLSTSENLIGHAINSAAEGLVAEGSLPKETLNELCPVSEPVEETLMAAQRELDEVNEAAIEIADHNLKLQADVEQLQKDLDEAEQLIESLNAELIGLRKIADKVAAQKVQAELPISSRKAQLKCFK